MPAKYRSLTEATTISTLAIVPSAAPCGQLEPGGDEDPVWLLRRQRNGDRCAAERTNASVRDSRFRADHV
jgi:hypothetical protein